MRLAVYWLLLSIGIPGTSLTVEPGLGESRHGVHRGRPVAPDTEWPLPTGVANGPEPLRSRISDVAFESISLRISLDLRTTLMQPVERRGLALLLIDDQLEHIANLELCRRISKGIAGRVDP